MNVELSLDNISFESERVSSKKTKKTSLKKDNNTYYWEPINEDWQTKLGSKHFMIKNCLGDGNCQFRSIETALTNAGYKTTHEKLRKKIAKYIDELNDSDFIHIIKTYQIEKQNGEFVGNWDPFVINNKKDFIKIIKKSGFDFQGDFITLEIMSRAIEVDILILTSDSDLINLSDPDKLQNKILILYYDKGGNGYGHYQTIGLKQKSGSVESIFKRSNLPNEIDRILDKHSFLLFHIKTICEKDTCGTSRIHLNYILKTLESRLKVKISRNDKKSVMKITRTLLENKDFFNNIS